jgi:hypothetical protein
LQDSFSHLVEANVCKVPTPEGTARERAITELPAENVHAAFVSLLLAEPHPSPEKFLLERQKAQGKVRHVFGAGAIYMRTPYVHAVTLCIEAQQTFGRQERLYKE